jgi:hypothetical protein
MPRKREVNVASRAVLDASEGMMDAERRGSRRKGRAKVAPAQAHGLPTPIPNPRDRVTDTPPPPGSDLYGLIGEIKDIAEVLGNIHTVNDLIRAAKSYAPIALATHIGIMRSEHTSDDDKMRAAEHILNRGFGRPAQPIMDPSANDLSEAEDNELTVYIQSKAPKFITLSPDSVIDMSTQTEVPKGSRKRRDK